MKTYAHKFQLVDLQGHQACARCDQLWDGKSTQPPCSPLRHKRNVAGIDVAVCGERREGTVFVERLSQINCPKCRASIMKNQVRIRANFKAVQDSISALKLDRGAK